MDRFQELTYLCGCKEGRFVSRAGYKPQDPPETVCEKCRKPADFGFQDWSWTAAAPKRGGPGAEHVSEEMMYFLSGLVPQLNNMSVEDGGVVVNRTASQLRIDGYQLLNKHGQIDANVVSDRAKRDITKIVQSQIEQLWRQHQKQQKKGSRAHATSAVVEDAVSVDVRRLKNHAPVRVVDNKQPKVLVGGAGFF
ncbi:hypothetical protein PG988_015349 [Apiospora saccharicola]